MGRILFTVCAALCLALTYTQNALAQQGGDLKSDATQYLAAQEPQLQQTTKPQQRMFLLTYLAPAALAAGETDKAGVYARELIELGQELKSQPGFGPSNYTQSTHVGNLVLGRIALEAGDVVGAKEHLLAAGRVPGSPTLKSFGPDMSLAKEMIEKGERETVIEYFDLCAKFWEMENGKLEQWKNIVKQGGMPNFGANTIYIFDAWRSTPQNSSTSSR